MTGTDPDRVADMAVTVVVMAAMTGMVAVMAALCAARPRHPRRAMDIIVRPIRITARHRRRNLARSRGRPPTARPGTAVAMSGRRHQPRHRLFRSLPRGFMKTT